jgi:hypothetical protein
MEEFSIIGESGSSIRIIFEEVYGFPESTCHWGGYDVRSRIEIKSGNFAVKSILWTSTGEIYALYEQLMTCNKNLKGEASYTSYEGNIQMNAVYDDLGHVTITGTFSEHNEFDNKLSFEFNSDQSYITSSISQLEKIVMKYGDMKGMKKQ